MRIAVWHNLPSGGGKRALHDHVRGLVARGHHVEAWCPPSADRTYLPLDALVTEHVVPLAWPAPRRRSDAWQITLEVNHGLAAMEAHCRQCAQQINAGGFDILFANTCRFFRAPPIGHFAALPAVLYLQEPFRWLYEALPRLPWLAPPRSSKLPHRRFRAAFVDQRNLRNLRRQGRAEVENAASFRRILVNSRFSRESVLRAYGIDADVCYLGIDTDFFRAGHRVREGFLVGLGSVTREKNLSLCIAAVASLPVPRPRLVWLGNMADTAYADEMRALAASCAVELDLRLRVSDAELLDILGRAFAMLYAPRLEPFGLAPLEANACGVPVIAVAEGGVRETVQDGVNGLLVDHDPAAMAAAITHLRNDPALALHLGHQARRVVEQQWGLQAGIDRIEARLTRYASTC